MSNKTKVRPQVVDVKALRNALLDSEMSDQELSIATGRVVSRSTITRWKGCSGTRPFLKQLVAGARALGVPPASLMMDAPEE